MNKILSVIATAYRATLEEQDDTSLWLNHACRKAGAAIDVLLTGNAVNYGTKFQNPKALNFGTGSISHPNKFHEDLQAFMATGAKILLIKEDAEERGIAADAMIGGIEWISRTALPRLL